MQKYSTLESRVSKRIARKKANVFLRDDFKDLGDYDQVGRVLRKLATKGKIVRIGYGLYAKTKVSALTGEAVHRLRRAVGHRRCSSGRRAAGQGRGWA